MKKKDNFSNDLPLGEEIEYRLLKHIKKKYPKSKKIKGEFKDYDLEVPEKDVKIEVKRDIGSKDTENYFIEHECNYKPSGITTTKANYWVIYDEPTFHWIKTCKLKSLCHLYGEPWEGIPKGGASFVRAYLIKKEFIITHSETTS